MGGLEATCMKDGSKVHPWLNMAKWMHHQRWVVSANELAVHLEKSCRYFFLWRRLDWFIAVSFTTGSALPCAGSVAGFFEVWLVPSKSLRSGLGTINERGLAGTKKTETDHISLSLYHSLSLYIYTYIYMTLSLSFSLSLCILTHVQEFNMIQLSIYSSQ